MGVAPESVPESDRVICCVSKAKTVSWSCAEAADGAATKAAADKAPATSAQDDLNGWMGFVHNLFTSSECENVRRLDFNSDEPDFAGRESGAQEKR